MSCGARIKTAAVTAKKNRMNSRFTLRKSAVRPAPDRSVSMGTNAKIMVLMRLILTVSIGLVATARESAALCVPRRNAVRATRKKPRMFPVIIPATMVSPPRTSGLPAARRTFDSSVPRSRPVRPVGSDSGAGGFRGSEGCIIIGMVGHLFHVLDVPDDVVLIQHEYG